MSQIRSILAPALAQLFLLAAAPQTVFASDIPEPDQVVVAGNFQTELGCPDDWQPDCTATALQFEEMIRIRASSPLFRLRTAEEVKNRLTFHNTGPDQIPGLIVMSLDDTAGEIDRASTRIVTLINALKEPVHFPFVLWEGRPFELHPVQHQSADPVVRNAAFNSETAEFFVPAQTIAVFLSPRPAGQRIELLIEDVQTLVDQGALNQGQANSLVSKLENTLRRLEGKNTPAAAHLLLAFINEAEALGLDMSLRAEAEEISILIRPGNGARVSLRPMGSQWKD